jgi:ATP adenylyltransferase
MGYVGGERKVSGCVFCGALASPDDRAALVLYRAEHAFLILNAYPYAPGHLMAVLNRHVGDVGDATPTELRAAMVLARDGVAALRAEYRAEGFNVGLNLGRVAGAGIEDHLHVHVVPRWNGDTNFMPVLGETRVLPEALEATYDRLKGRFHG